MATNNPDFLESLAQMGNNSGSSVVGQVASIPDFLRRLITGYKTPDLNAGRKEKQIVQKQTKLKDKEGNPITIPQTIRGGYPETNQFMGETLQPFIDFGNKDYGDELKDSPPVVKQITQAMIGGGNLVNATAQRIGLLKKAIETSPSLDVFADGLSQAGFELKNWGKFFGSDPESKVTPFGESLNYQEFGGEVPYDRLQTEEARFNYLKQHPEFTPPEWKTEDKKTKSFMTQPQWDTYQMFRTPRSPRVRKGKNGRNTE